MKIKINAWKCERCGHNWVARKKEIPRSCPNPKCRSIYWDKPKRVKLDD